MNINEVINMAICAVTMDNILPMSIKKELNESLAEIERLAEIGKALERAFCYDAEIKTYTGSINTFKSAEELVECSESFD